MNDLPVINDYRALFIDDMPMLDVRAPVEYDKGAFPLADNRPLLEDYERHEIGIRYKEDGHDAAMDMGRDLIAGEIKNRRVEAWNAFVEQHPDGALYCFRGGMRSRITQQWIYEATGIRYPRIEGGYKALRSFLIDELDRSAEEINTVVIGGRTGVGKTLLLHRVDNMIDLEGLANHRGSAFGHFATPQPTQINFENELSIALLKHRARGNVPLVMEDEGRNIGSVHFSEKLYDRFSQGALILLEASMEERVEITWQEYVVEALGDFNKIYGDEGFERWKTYVLGSFDRIRKRLGGVRHQAMQQKITAAMEEHQHSGDGNVHREWIETLLSDYYDPMYDYQIQKKQERIVFSGSSEEVIDYLKAMTLGIPDTKERST